MTGTETPRLHVHWYQPSVWRRRYELRLRGATVGSYQQKGFFDSTGIYEMDGRRWTLAARGVLRSTYRVVDAESGGEIAEFRGGSYFNYGGTLTLHSGTTFAIKTSNIWGTRFRVTDAEGRPAADWRISFGFSRNVVTVSVAHADLDAEELAVLCLVALRIKITMINRAMASS